MENQLARVPISHRALLNRGRTFATPDIWSFISESTVLILLLLLLLQFLFLKYKSFYLFFLNRILNRVIKKQYRLIFFFWFNHHLRSLPAQSKNFPVYDMSALLNTSNKPVALVSVLIKAFGPPISV